MSNKKINLEYIMQFNPCEEGVNRYLKAGYGGFNGNILDFIKINEIPFNDIKWIIFHRNQKILSDNLMREFALLCSPGAVEEVSVPEITYLYDIGLLEYISGEEIDSAARSAAYSAASSAAFAANYAAYSGASRAAEENIQKEILIDLIENGLVIMPEINAR